MDDQTEITRLLKAYQAKGMTADAARRSLQEMGYSDDAISEGLQAAGYSSAIYKDPNEPTASNSADWDKVGSDILNEQRSWQRNLAWSGIIFLGGITGWRVYVLFWRGKQTLDQNCQQNTFPVLKTNPCLQHAVDPTGVMLSIAVGVVAAVLIAKLCYYIADKIRQRNSS